MGRTFIIGSDSWSPLAAELGANHVAFPSVTGEVRRRLVEEDQQIRVDRMLHSFVVERHFDMEDCCIVDIDEDPVIAILLVFHIRLSLESNGIGSLIPIVCSSELSLETLMEMTDYASVLCTRSVYLCRASKIKEKLPYIGPLPIEAYRSGFLDRITIRPPAEIGTHSLANLWGASVLSRLVHEGNPSDEKLGLLSDVKKILYLKYILAKTSEIKDLILPQRVIQLEKVERINAYGKRILLLDDMASVGWKDALSDFFLHPDAFDVIDHSVRSFSAYKEEEQDMILNGEYDVILLDLRLGGQEEDEIMDPDYFSGMDVLRSIKANNRGSQVIIFTASNKAWNYKFLTDRTAGANGYYIKESPETVFNSHFSYSNLRSLRSDIERCFDKKYLRRFYSIKDSFSNGLDLKLDKQTAFVKEVKSQLDIAYSMAETAYNETSHQYAFLALYQVIEIVTKYFTRSQDDKLILVHNDGTEEDAKFPVQRINSPLYELSDNGQFDDSNWVCLAVVIMQLCDRKDFGIVDLLRQVIKLRNDFIHLDPKFGSSRPISQQELYMHHDAQNTSLIYSNPIYFEVLDSMASKKMLYTFHRRICMNRSSIRDKEGIEIALLCLDTLFEIIKPVI